MKDARTSLLRLTSTMICTQCKIDSNDCQKSSISCSEQLRTISCLAKKFYAKHQALNSKSSNKESSMKDATTSLLHSTSTVICTQCKADCNECRKSSSVFMMITTMGSAAAIFSYIQLCKKAYGIREKLVTHSDCHFYE